MNEQEMKTKGIVIKMLVIDIEKCVGCGACVDVCPDGFEIKDGKSVVVDPDAPCIGKAISTCPIGAIRSDAESIARGKTRSSGFPATSGGGGRGKAEGRGMGRGKGRGLGIGPRDGRGRGRGGGGKRR